MNQINFQAPILKFFVAQIFPSFEQHAHNLDFTKRKEFVVSHPVKHGFKIIKVNPYYDDTKAKEALRKAKEKRESKNV